MQQNKLISIVLATYNGEKYFREALDSIIAQSYTNFELIIIDDGSTDSTGTIALEYAEKDSRIHYYKNEINLKQAASLNRGFALSKGEYLTWTSDDNNLLPNCLEKLAEYLDDHEDCDLCFGRFDYFFENSSALNFFKNFKEKSLKHKNFYHLVECLVGAAFLYRRKVYENIGDYSIDKNKSLALDFEYWIRVSLKYNINPIDFDECIYYFRVHSNAASTKYNNELLYQSLFIMCEYYKNFIMTFKEYVIFKEKIEQLYKNIDKNTIYYEKSLKIVNQLEKDFKEINVNVNLSENLFLITENTILKNNKWYRFGQLSKKQKIKKISIVLSKKLKIYGLIKFFYRAIKPIFKIKL